MSEAIQSKKFHWMFLPLLALALSYTNSKVWIHQDSSVQDNVCKSTNQCWRNLTEDVVHGCLELIFQQELTQGKLYSAEDQGVKIKRILHGTGIPTPSLIPLAVHTSSGPTYSYTCIPDGYPVKPGSPSPPCPPGQHSYHTTPQKYPSNPAGPPGQNNPYGYDSNYPSPPYSPDYPSATSYPSSPQYSGTPVHPSRHNEPVPPTYSQISGHHNPQKYISNSPSNPPYPSPSRYTSNSQNNPSFSSVSQYTSHTRNNPSYPSPSQYIPTSQSNPASLNLSRYTSTSQNNPFFFIPPQYSSNFQINPSFLNPPQYTLNSPNNPTDPIYSLYPFNNRYNPTPGPLIYDNLPGYVPNEAGYPTFPIPSIYGPNNFPFDDTPPFKTTSYSGLTTNPIDTQQLFDYSISPFDMNLNTIYKMFGIYPSLSSLSDGTPLSSLLSDLDINPAVLNLFSYPGSSFVPYYVDDYSLLDTSYIPLATSSVKHYSPSYKSSSRRRTKLKIKYKRCKPKTVTVIKLKSKSVRRFKAYVCK